MTIRINLFRHTTQIRGQAMIEALVILPALLVFLCLIATLAGGLGWTLLLEYQKQDAELCSREFEKIKLNDQGKPKTNPCSKNN